MCKTNALPIELISIINYLSVAISNNVFSINPIEGTIIRNHEKYNAVHTIPNPTNGFSTCADPNLIKIKKFTANTQNANLINGLYCDPLILDVSNIGNNNNINNEANIATTPNSLLGIDLNIA